MLSTEAEQVGMPAGGGREPGPPRWKGRKEAMRKTVSLLMLTMLLVPCVTGCRAGAETRTGEAEGYGGKLTVSVTMNGEDITSVKVVSHQETEGVGTRAIEALPPEIVKTDSTDVDVVSGATITSNAVIKAVNSLLPAAAGVSAKVQTLTASAKGLMSTVNVEITVDAAGAITDIQVDCSGETRVIAAPCAEEPFLSQFVGRVGPFDDIDVVTGATYTSNAVINAVNSLFPIN